ncbi:MAG: hypothetical protein PXX82_02975 [Methanomassiliicoccales archaeon]|nr:hypothetical protein [Methanomassiliicoccales archaeon]
MKTKLGRPYPQGVTLENGGANFALYSENATGVTLELYNRHDSGTPTEQIELRERDGFVWHIHVSGIKPGDLYGFRVNGPYNPGTGQRFNRNKLLIDPYARAISGVIDWNNDIFGYDIGDVNGDLSFNKNDDAASVPKSVVSDNGLTGRAQRIPGFRGTER